MNPKEIIAWLIIFILVTVIFNYNFPMIINPAGEHGEPTIVNIFASLLYIVAWIIISVAAGRKKNEKILAAGVIYAFLPFVSVLGVIFAGTPLGYIILIFFFWGVPVQGIHFSLMFFQLPIFLVGYKMGSNICE